MSATLRRYMHTDGQFQVFVADTTLVGQAVFQQLQCSPIAVQLLTQAMTSAALLSANIKSQGTLMLRFRGDGPVGHVTAEANTEGHLRATMGQLKLMVDHDGTDLFHNAVGKGLMTLKRRTQMTDGIYESVVELIDGEMALNLANYLLTSEQIPAAVQLSAHLDAELGVAGAGGVLIQAMPGANENLLFVLESRLQELPSLAEFFVEPDGQDRLQEELFGHIPVKATGSHKLRYFCPCDRQKMLQVIATLPSEDLQSLLDDNHDQTVNCSYCGKGYAMSPEDFAAILDMKRNPA